MKVYKDIIQGTPEWLMLRKGRPSASRFSEIITPKEKPSSSANGYMRELIAETFCPTYEQWKGNKYTDAGTALEPEAREAFAKHTGLTLEQVGFCLADDGICGCSPDSLITECGSYVAGLEIKCKSPMVHTDYVMDGILPPDVTAQIHGGLVITGLSEWHFWSYYPGMKPLHVIVKPDDFTEKLKDALSAFVVGYKAEYERAIPLLKL